MEQKSEYRTDDGQEAAREYKPVWVKADLHRRVKVLAARLGVTMNDLIEAAIKNKETNQ